MELFRLSYVNVDENGKETQFPIISKALPKDINIEDPEVIANLMYNYLKECFGYDYRIQNLELMNVITELKHPELEGFKTSLSIIEQPMERKDFISAATEAIEKVR